MVGAIMDAMTEADKAAAKAAKAKAKENAEGEEEEEEEEEMQENKGPKANKGKVMTNAEIDDLVSRRVADHLDRAEVKRELTANAANPFSEEELNTLPVTTLQKTAKAIRPVDYSGQGGFAAHANGGGQRTGKVAPLLANRGVLADPPKAAAK